MDIGTKTVLCSTFGNALSRVIGYDPVHKEWVVEITSAKHPLYRRGQRIWVDVRSTLLVGR